MARIRQRGNTVLAHPAPLDLFHARPVLDAGVEELAERRVDELEERSLPGRILGMRTHVFTLGEPLDPAAPIVPEGLPGQPVEGIRHARVEEEVEAEDVDQARDRGSLAPPDDVAQRRFAEGGLRVQEPGHELVQRWLGASGGRRAGGHRLWRVRARK